MKIGYILNYDLDLSLPRGDAIHVLSFIENIAKVGHEIFLIQKNNSNTKINYVKSYNISSPTKFKKLNKLAYGIVFCFRLSSIIKKETPTLIHEREIGWRTYLNFGGILLAKKNKIPYVLEVNAPILYERGIYHSYFSCKIEEISEKVLFSRANRIIVVSNVLKNYVMSKNIPSEKVIVVPNGANEKLLNPNISGKKIRKKYNLENKRIICFSGSLDQEWQGIDEILKSAEMISSIDPTIYFLIIGDLKEQDQTKNSPQNVIFTGAINHSDLPNYLAAADILLAPYKLKEQFKEIGFYNSPVKLFEYMAMGKPIIASNIGQISEVIEHGKTGLLIEPGNYQELTSNILTLFENKQLREELGVNAREELVRNYTWKINADKIVNVYKDLIKNNS